MNKKMREKSTPLQLVDNVPRDTCEQIVELYYQCQGYITSSNKWFKSEGGKGYRDIDVIALKDKELVLVSVSTNQKDKNIDKLKKYFKEVINHLRKTEDLRWLLDNAENGEPRKELAVFSYSNKRIGKEKDDRIGDIDVLYAEKIFKYFREHLIAWRESGLKTEHPLVKTIQLVDYYMRSGIDKSRIE